MQEEISHCGAGVRWLTYLFDQAAQQDPPAVEPSELELQPQSFPDVESWFHALVRRHFKGDLKVCACHVIWQFTLCLRLRYCRIRLSEPDAREAHLTVIPPCAQPPFNEEARAAAGFTAQWWQPLTARRGDAPASVAAVTA